MYAASLASTSTVAEDAVQETFLRAWRHLDSFRGDGSFEGWLIRICRRCVIDLERRERRAARQLERPLTTIEHPDGTGESLAVLAALSRDHREILVVCGLLGYDYESAAEVLDLRVGTVRSRLHRARAAFADALDAGETRSA
jgi:RNA polymerase sigma-70 factor (ECF subfamily)